MLADKVSRAAVLAPIMGLLLGLWRADGRLRAEAAIGDLMSNQCSGSDCAGRRSLSGAPSGLFTLPLLFCILLRSDAEKRPNTSTADFNNSSHEAQFSLQRVLLTARGGGSYSALAMLHSSKANSPFAVDGVSFHLQASCSPPLLRRCRVPWTPSLLPNSLPSCATASAGWRPSPQQLRSCPPPRRCFSPTLAGGDTGSCPGCSVRRWTWPCQISHSCARSLKC